MYLEEGGRREREEEREERRGKRREKQREKKWREMGRGGSEGYLDTGNFVQLLSVCMLFWERVASHADEPNLEHAY